MKLTIVGGSISDYFMESEILVVPFHTNYLSEKYSPKPSKYEKDMNNIIGNYYYEQIKKIKKMSLGDTFFFNLKLNDDQIKKQVAYIVCRNFMGRYSEKAIIESVEKVLILASQCKIKTVLIPILKENSNLTESKITKLIQNVCVKYESEDITILLLNHRNG